MGVCVDKRKIHSELRPGALRQLRGGSAKLRELEVGLAKAFTEVHESGAFLYEEAASIQQLGVRYGYGEDTIRRLLTLGRVLRDMPGLSERVEDGRIAVDNAIALSRVARRPALLESGEDWLKLASELPPKDLRSRITQRIEDLAQGQATQPMRLMVTGATREKFGRCRALMAGEFEDFPTEGQVLGTLADFWLGRRDPRARVDRSDAGTPSGGARGTNSASRGIPVAVLRAVQARSGGTCECCKQRRATQLAHVVPHRKGGPATVDNIVHLCTLCHKLLDSGLVHVDDRDCDGAPRFGWSKEHLEAMKTLADREARSAAGKGDASPPDEQEPPSGASLVRSRGPSLLRRGAPPSRRPETSAKSPRAPPPCVTVVVARQ